MTTLRQVVEDSDTKWGRVFDLATQCLIVVSLVTFSIETLPNLSDTQRQWLRWNEVATVGLFTAEYLLRVVVAERKTAYVLSFSGIVDLVAILPFYLASGSDLRSLRAFRLLRLFRVFKMVRYSKAVRRLHRALLIAKEELVLFLCVATLLLSSPPLASTTVNTTHNQRNLRPYFTACGGRSRR